MRDSHKAIWIAGIAACSLVVGVWLATVRHHEWEDERFDSISALFSGLAFSALLVALLFQKQDLMMQQRELEGQKEQLALQNATMRKQSFENTFFQLLSLHHDIVRAMDLAPQAQDQHGRACFRVLYGFLCQQAANHPPPADLNVKQGLSYIYLAFYGDYQQHVGHYFRNLYHIIRLVDQSEVLSNAEKIQYTALVRAQLSSHELLLLFYNCLAAGVGAGEFSDLVHRYALLKNVTTRLLINEGIHSTLYDHRAYGQGQPAVAAEA